MMKRGIAPQLPRMMCVLVTKAVVAVEPLRSTPDFSLSCNSQCMHSVMKQ